MMNRGGEGGWAYGCSIDERVVDADGLTDGRTANASMTRRKS